MTLKQQEIEHLAKLVRLELTGPEQTEFSEEISEVLQYVESLQQLQGFEVGQITAEPETVLRTDLAKPWPAEEQKQLIEAAPAQQDNLIKTKPVFER